MSILKSIVPLFIVLGLLQAAVLALPLIYWRLHLHLHPIHRFLLGTFFCFIAFILHPLIVITLITFTIAPTLLSMRHSLSSRLSTVYTALIPDSLQTGLLERKGLPQTNRDWLLTALSSYVGWKALGALPFVAVVGVFFALRGGKEQFEREGRRAVRGETEVRRGLQEVERRGAGEGLRSRRTDVQVVG